MKLTPWGPAQAFPKQAQACPNSRVGSARILPLQLGLGNNFLSALSYELQNNPCSWRLAPGFLLCRRRGQISGRMGEGGSGSGSRACEPTAPSPAERPALHSLLVGRGPSMSLGSDTLPSNPGSLASSLISLSPIPWSIKQT